MPKEDGGTWPHRSGEGGEDVVHVLLAAALLEQMWSSVIHVHSLLRACCVPMQKKDKKEAQKCFIAAVEQADFPAKELVTYPQANAPK